MSKPTPIRTLLDSLIAAKGWKGKVELHRVFDFWEDAVGKDIARQAQPHVVRKTVLWIRVSDSVWMQQLHLLKEMILEKLNGRMKKQKFTDLRFQLDSSLGYGGVCRDEEPPMPKLVQPDAKSRESFERLLDTIHDAEIKKAMRKCWLKVGHLSRKEEKR